MRVLRTNGCMAVLCYSLPPHCFVSRAPLLCIWHRAAGQHFLIFSVCRATLAAEKVRLHMSDCMITIANVKKDFGGNPVFNEINLEVLDGQRIGLVGENGSGKSTLFKLMVGL